MKDSKHNNSTLEGCADKISAKSELLSIVQQYSKMIDMIASTTIVDERSKK